MSTALKEEQVKGRFSIRVRESDEHLIRKGAQYSKTKNVSEYLIQSALTQAKFDLADRMDFTLSSDKVEAFFEALEKPAMPIPALTQLFGKKTMFD